MQCICTVIASAGMFPSCPIVVCEALAAVREPLLVAWRRIVAALDMVTDPEELQVAISAVESSCASVSDSIRLAPGRWIRTLCIGQPEPRLRVVRAVKINLHDVDIAGDRFAWTDAPDLAHVSILRVFDERFNDDVLERWLRFSMSRRITDLALGGGMTDRGACRLAADECLSNIENLGLFRNEIGSVGLAALIGSPWLGRKLRRLLLGRNWLGQAGAAALASETAIGDLDLLDLDCNRLDGGAIRNLVKAPVLSGVRVLNLSNNPIGAEGCAALASCRYLDQIEVLFLHGCQLDDEAVATLLRAPFMSRLRNLALSANELSMSAIERIASRRDLRLSELDVCHNRFGEAEAEMSLRSASFFPGLFRLCV